MQPKLVIDLLTLFPEMVSGYFDCSMLGKAIRRGLIAVNLHNIRDWATDKHKVTDDRPFGGGAGMVMKPEPLVAAIESLRRPESTVIYLAPEAERFNSKVASDLAMLPHLVLVSGHYEGIDQRVRDHWIDRELSIGDYVLTNGTLPAAVIVDAVARFIPDVLGEPTSHEDAFADGRLSYPQYTRPADFRGHTVPEVLVNGHHAEIEKWRKQQQKKKTQQNRSDLTETIE